MKLSSFAVVWLLLTTTVPVGAASPPISAVEEQIVEYIDANVEQAIALLEQVVNINSGTMNPEGVVRVGRVFQAEFDELGFDTRWIPMQAVNRAGHLFAQRSGGPGKRLLLIGHLDTVFEADSDFQRFTRRGSVARGPGAEDMKGGDVVLLYAVKALHAAGVLDNTSITVALIGDEEDTGDPLSISRGDLVEAARHSDVALGFESSVGDSGAATVARRGFTGWEVRVTAESGHSSQIFKKELGTGAIYEAARVLTDFYRELSGEQHLTFNPGIIVGGTSSDYDPVLSRGNAFGKTNVISGTAVVAGDLRFISTAQRERAKQRMSAIVSNSLPHTSSTITFEDSSPPMSPTPGNQALLTLLDQVSRDLGHGPVAGVDPSDRGAADISFVARYLDGLDGLGAAGTRAHTTEETVDLDSIAKAAKRAAVLMYRLTQQVRP